MRLLLVAAALWAMLSCAATSSAAGPDWRGLGYFHYDLYELSIGTSGAWTNARALPARLEGYVPRGFLASWARDRGQRFDTVWLPTCQGGSRQQASFRTTFYAPGQASRVKGWLSFAESDPARSGIASTRILLNGIPIASAQGHRKGVNQIGARRDGESELPPAGKAFRVGLNTLEVRVDKAKQRLAGFPARCGISFALSASFVADMELGKSRQSAQQASVPRYARLDPGASAAAQVTATVRNDGPAASLDGKLVVTVGSSMLARGVSISGTGALAKCTRTVLEAWLPPFECAYTDWRPGEVGSLTITVSARVTEAVNYAEQSISLTFSLGGAGGRDAPPGIDYIPYTLVACGPGATSAGCAAARGWGDP